MQYQSRLDHLRFFAATSVVLHHCSNKFTWSEQLFADSVSATAANLVTLVLRKGFAGLSPFMVLSGFLLCLICRAGQKKIAYSQFMHNRILRIYPLLTLIFFIVICITWRESGPLDILRLLTAQFNTGNPQGTGWGSQVFPTGTIWTLAVEFQFYLLFPFLALFLQRYGPWYILGLIAIIILCRYAVIGLRTTGMAEVAEIFHHTIIGRLDQFLLGMLLAYLCVHDAIPKVLRHDTVKWCLLCAGLIVLMAFVGFKYVYLGRKDQIEAFVPTLEAALWCPLVYCYSTVKLGFPQVIDKSLAALGRISYSIFLLHAPVGTCVMVGFGLTFPDTIAELMPFAFGAVLAPTILLSALTYAVIEKPFLSLKKRYC